MEKKKESKHVISVQIVQLLHSQLQKKILCMDALNIKFSTYHKK